MFLTYKPSILDFFGLDRYNPGTMRKFLLLFGILALTPLWLLAKPVQADSGVCNKSCQVNEDCGKGYRCYVGICRAVSCPSSPNCECVVAITPSPTIKPQVTTQPKATPIASASSQIKKTPKTGISVPTLLFASVALAFSGLILKGMSGNM